MKEYTRHVQKDSKMANSIFESAYYKQAKHPDKLINVSYGLRVTRNNLEDVKLLIDYKKLMLDIDLKDGLISKKYVEDSKRIYNQLEKSIDKTISELFGKGEK